MAPSILVVGSALVYLTFMGVLGVATGLLVALLSRRRPTGREVLIDFAVAGTAAIVSATILAVYESARGLSSSGAPTLIPIAVGSVAIRYIMKMLRRKRHQSREEAGFGQQ